MTEFDFTAKELQLMSQVVIKAGGGVVITMAETAGLTPSERADFIFKVASVAAGLDCRQASPSTPSSDNIEVGDKIILHFFGFSVPREEPATVLEIDGDWVRCELDNRPEYECVWRRISSEDDTWRRA